MDLTNEITFDAVASVVRSESDVIVGMRRLLDHCAKVQPSPVWEKISQLDFARGADSLREWLQSLLTAEPPPAEVVAFWFGIFDSSDLSPADPVDDDAPPPPPIATLYVAGSELYDPEDPSAEWACSPEYFPKGRYADSAMLRALSEILSEADDDAFELGTYVLPFGYAALMVSQCCREIPIDIWLSERDSRAIAVGFDSGDYVTLPAVARAAGVS
jgi:hypothetical protein